ncbi:hypothetical protein MWH30_08115 [Fuchsiella alkaliacetigena]|nr:hypothetical protein [Fuchsiella alkaliacetigena]
MDDYLDRYLDKTSGKRTLAFELKQATLPYALLSFSLAVALDYSSALSLFWASYILGMGYDYQKVLPTGLKSYQESLILLLLGAYLLSFLEVISALGIILTIQLLDDLIDLKEDQLNYRNNFVYLLGKRQVVLLVLLLSTINIYLDFEKTIMVYLTAPLIVKLVEKEKKVGKGLVD